MSDPALAGFIAQVSARIDLSLLDDGHPARILAEGRLPEAIAIRAQALLRAELLRE